MADDALGESGCSGVDTLSSKVGDGELVPGEGPSATSCSVEMVVFALKWLSSFPPATVSSSGECDDVRQFAVVLSSVNVAAGDHAMLSLSESMPSGRRATRLISAPAVAKRGLPVAVGKLAESSSLPVTAWGLCSSGDGLPESGEAAHKGDCGLKQLVCSSGDGDDGRDAAAGGIALIGGLM